jgi:general secretion pathway protein D
MLSALLALGLCAAQTGYAQRTFGGGGGAAGGGGGSRTTSGSRQYTPNGTIGDAYFSIDPETRRIVTIADEQTSLAISQVLSNLDRPKPQVLIKVVFLEVTHNNSSDLGVEGSFSRNIGNSYLSGGIVTNFSMGSSNNLISTLAPATKSTTMGGSSAFGFPTSGAAGLYQILGQDYQVTLHAIASAGNAKILSRPSILARNNQPATITVGQSVPLITSVRYDSLGNAINSVSYTDVGVILKVTPFITADGLVEMIIAPQISSIDPTLSIPISASVNAPVIDIRSADTVAVTPDGQTVIIGGLMEASRAQTDTKIPILGDIPLLGNLFKRKQKNDDRRELMIFLTPHIVQAPSQLAALSTREKEKSDAPKEFNDKELDKFLDTLPAKEPTPNHPGKPNTAAPYKR